MADPLPIRGLLYRKEGDGMNRRSFILRCLAAAGLWQAGSWQAAERLWAAAESHGDREYYRIVVLSDPHLPVKLKKHKNAATRKIIREQKLKVIQDINGWSDVDEITVTGDIAAQFGVESEYAYAKKYFSGFASPLHILAGNHDYIYEDEPSENGKNVWADAAGRQRKLDRFKEIWQMPSLSYVKEAGGCRLFYLSPESLEKYSVALSQQQLAWLRQELAKAPQKPAIVFFHAPLAGTLADYNKSVNHPNAIAQPEAAIDQLLRDNPQVFLWVSGHTHTPATEPSYADEKINLYAGRVMDIHTSTLDRTMVWSNSLYLYPDRVEVKTFNHTEGRWEDKLDRQIRLPRI